MREKHEEREEREQRREQREEQLHPATPTAERDGGAAPLWRSVASDRGALLQHFGEKRQALWPTELVCWSFTSWCASCGGRCDVCVGVESSAGRSRARGSRNPRVGHGERSLEAFRDSLSLKPLGALQYS